MTTDEAEALTDKIEALAVGYLQEIAGLVWALDGIGHLLSEVPPPEETEAEREERERRAEARRAREKESREEARARATTALTTLKEAIARLEHERPGYFFLASEHQNVPAIPEPRFPFVDTEVRDFGDWVRAGANGEYEQQRGYFLIPRQPTGLAATCNEWLKDKRQRLDGVRMRLLGERQAGAGGRKGPGRRQETDPALDAEVARRREKGRRGKKYPRHADLADSMNRDEMPDFDGKPYTPKKIAAALARHRMRGQPNRNPQS